MYYLYTYAVVPQHKQATPCRAEQANTIVALLTKGKRLNTSTITTLYLSVNIVCVYRMAGGHDCQTHLYLVVWDCSAYL